jgi:hypothetical protein
LKALLKKCSKTLGRTFTKSAAKPSDALLKKCSKTLGRTFTKSAAKRLEALLKKCSKTLGRTFTKTFGSIFVKVYSFFIFSLRPAASANILFHIYARLLSHKCVLFFQVGLLGLFDVRDIAHFINVVGSNVFEGNTFFV